MKGKQKLCTYNKDMCTANKFVHFYALIYIVVSRKYFFLFFINNATTRSSFSSSSTMHLSTRCALDNIQFDLEMHKCDISFLCIIL